MWSTALRGLGCGVVFVAACGGASPASDCSRAVSVFCQRAFQCDTTTAVQTYGSEANCQTQGNSTAQCSSLVCPKGTTYNGAQYEQCLSDIQALPCTQTQQPASCNGASGVALCK